MPDWIVKPYLKNRDIVAIPVSLTIDRRMWYAATIKHTPAIQNFVDCLKQHFGADTKVSTGGHRETEMLKREERDFFKIKITLPNIYPQYFS
ncbi:MAG: hypothetical protein ABIN91_08470 [Mucilaginibacter sp.]|uniref:hypothetical protein n=1 Tax=Mucilaginibacter sp. TaxID=1882438 RepID=UPI003263EC4C